MGLVRAKGLIAPASLLLTAAGVVTAAGCVGPLGPRDEDYGRRLPARSYRSVDRLDLAQFQQPPEAPDAAPARARVGRLEGAERIELTIEECRAAALTNNLDLRAALVSPAIAAQGVREEEARFEAVFRPFVRYRDQDEPTFQTTAGNQQTQFQAGAGVSVPLRTGGRVNVDLIQSRTETPSPFFALDTAYASALELSISQPLLRNAGRRASTYFIRLASYEDQIARARTKLEVIRQLAAVDRSYWRLYAARRELDVRQSQFDLANAQLERARRRVAAGAAADVEVLRAESGLAERLEAIIIAENTVLLQQRELKRILNAPDLPVGSRTLIQTGTPPDPVAYLFDGGALSEMAVANRMEMLELELRIAADAATVEFNRNQALPLVTLDYTYRLSGLDTSLGGANREMLDGRFDTWTVGLSGEIPIGNEAARARVQRAILTRLQRLSTAEARRLAITQETLDAVDRVEAGWQRILAARQATVAAARTLEAEQRQFDVGARTSTDVLDAATRLAESQTAEIRAIADYQIALVDLAFATGTLLGAAGVEWDADAESRAADAAPERGTTPASGPESEPGAAPSAADR